MGNKTPEIVRWMRTRTSYLADGYMSMDQTATGAMATLRKCADGKTHSGPEILQWTLEGLSFDDIRNADGMINEKLMGYRQWAASLTLGLFAVAQRANRGRSMQDDDTPFMAAIAAMAAKYPEKRNGLTRQRAFIDQTDDEGSLASHFRALARQLNGAGIPCDWGWLAFRLEQWANPNTRNLARLNWGETYYIKPSAKNTEDKGSKK